MSLLLTSRTQVLAGRSGEATAVIALPSHSARGARGFHLQVPTLHLSTCFGHWSPLLVHPEQARTFKEFKLQGAALITCLTRSDGESDPLVGITLRSILHHIQSRRIDLQPHSSNLLSLWSVTGFLPFLTSLPAPLPVLLGVTSQRNYTHSQP